MQCNQLREEKAEIQGVADERGESLRRSRELLQIPLEDVRMTGIKLGGGAYGGKALGKGPIDPYVRASFHRSEDGLLAWLLRCGEDYARIAPPRSLP